MERSKPSTINDGAYATNPGNVTLKPVVWFCHRTKTVLGLLAIVILSAFAALIYSYYVFGVTVLAILINFFYWWHKAEQFKYGDSNAAMVVSTEPPLLAIFTDLTKSDGLYPVIKIIPYHTKKTIRYGDRVGTVALYYDYSEPREYWEDFNPIPIDYATNEQVEIEKAIHSYPEQQWALIEKGISEIDIPYKPGLYRVDIHSSDWQKA